MPGMVDAAGSAARVLILGSLAVADATARAFEAQAAQVSHQPDPGRAAVAETVANAAMRLGGLDICVYMVVPTITGPVLAVDEAAWADDVMGQLSGAHRAALAAARVMAPGGGGSIVLVGSMDAMHAYPGRSAAAVAMSGLLGLVRALAIELAGAGIRVNAVLAGPTQPREVHEALRADDGRVARTLLRSPSHRFVRPEEVAAGICFVAGRGAAFMTGQALRVDAGWASLNQAPDGMKFP
jgi:NAD(P)-dependent dehydrogenase (short-subunit alcohol dehydrogenase family)